MEFQKLLCCYIFYVIVNFVTYTKAQCDLQPTADGEFHRISAISKYVGFTSSVKNSIAQTYHESKSICEDADLEMAEVTSLVDHWSLSTHSANTKAYWIGMNDIEDEGKFKDAKGDDIVFQSFGIGDPGDVNATLNCVQLNHGNGAFRMRDKNCNSKAAVLCQFKEGSYCNEQTFQRSAEHIIGGMQDLMPLGDSTDVFVSTIQKPFDLALVSCMLAEKVPMFINNSDFSNLLVRHLKSHIMEMELDLETQFWTGGRLERNEEGGFTGNLMWDVLENFYNWMENPKNISFMWAPDEPNDIGASDENGCLDIAFASDSEPLYWQSSNCRLPKFFLCMNSNYSITKREMERRIKYLILQDYDGHYHPKSKPMPEFHAAKAHDNAPHPNDGCPPEPLKYVDPITINMTQLALTIPQTQALMIFNVKNLIKNGNVKVKVKKSIAWKRELIDNIFNIFMKAVSTEVVPHAFLHVAREVNMMYLNSIIHNGTEERERNDWEGILDTLDTCGEYMPEYLIIVEGLRATRYNDIPLEDYVEPEDMSRIDLIIDVMWYVFSFSLGACYPSGTRVDPLVWAAEFYTLFNVDILHRLMKKWTNEDDNNLLKAGLILGDIDLILSMENLKAVVVVPYLENDIMDRRVFRPLEEV